VPDLLTAIDRAEAQLFSGIDYAMSCNTAASAEQAAPASSGPANLVRQPDDADSSTPVLSKARPAQSRRDTRKVSANIYSQLADRVIKRKTPALESATGSDRARADAYDGVVFAEDVEVSIIEPSAPDSAPATSAQTNTKTHAAAATVVHSPAVHEASREKRRDDVVDVDASSPLSGTAPVRQWDSSKEPTRGILSRNVSGSLPSKASEPVTSQPILLAISAAGSSRPQPLARLSLPVSENVPSTVLTARATLSHRAPLTPKPSPDLARVLPSTNQVKEIKQQKHQRQLQQQQQTELFQKNQLPITAPRKSSPPVPSAACRSKQAPVPRRSSMPCRPPHSLPPPARLTKIPPVQCASSQPPPALREQPLRSLVSAADSSPAIPQLVVPTPSAGAQTVSASTASHVDPHLCKPNRFRSTVPPAIGEAASAPPAQSTFRLSLPPGVILVPGAQPVGNALPNGYRSTPQGVRPVITLDPRPRVPHTLRQTFVDRLFLVFMENGRPEMESIVHSIMTEQK
jgi:hypothetical protein